MQWDHPVFPLQSMVISTQPRSVILFGFCQKVPWHGMWCKNVMKKNSFFQHYHFLHNKFHSNDKSLQIHKRWYNYGEWLFETVLDHKRSWFLSFILKRGGGVKHHCEYIHPVTKFATTSFIWNFDINKH